MPKLTEYEREKEKLEKLATFNYLISRVMRAEKHFFEMRKNSIELDISSEEYAIFKTVINRVSFVIDELSVMGINLTDSEKIAGANIDFHISKKYTVRYFIEKYQKQEKDNQTKMDLKKK